jgi:hypothetical protein
MGATSLRLDHQDDQHRTFMETVEKRLPDRLRVVLSDNIQPRCGCPKPGKWWVHWLFSDGEAFGVYECHRCEATWPWGEIGAREAKRGRARKAAS